MPGVLMSDMEQNNCRLSINDNLLADDSHSTLDGNLNFEYPLPEVVNSNENEPTSLTNSCLEFLSLNTPNSSSSSERSLHSDDFINGDIILMEEENTIGFIHSDLAKYEVKNSPRKSPTKTSPTRLSQGNVLKSYNNSQEIQTDSSDACDSELERDKLSGSIIDVTCPNCITHHVGREMLDKVYNIPIDTLFTLLFTNSKFMLDLHTNRKTTDVQCTNWQSDEETNQKIRQVTYILTLPTNSLGPKVSHVTETQVMAPHSAPGEIYSIDVEACNGGIPYADSFFVSNHWCLTTESSDETRLSVWTQVKYKKSVWGFMKNVIDKNSYNGVDNMMIDLNGALNNEVNRTPQKGLRRRRRRLGSKGGDDLLYQGEGIEHSGDLKGSFPNHKAEKSDMRHSAGHGEKMFYAIVFILLLLLFMNVLLYYRLYSLETKFNENSSNVMESSLIRIGKAGGDGLVNEWMHILRQQEKIHSDEISRWRRSVRDAADHLQRAEESLRNLQTSIPSQQRLKIQSLLDHLLKIKNKKVNSLFKAENISLQQSGTSEL